MTASTRPLLAIYVVWHPDFTDGSKWSDILHSNFRRDLFASVSGGIGLSVLERSQAPAGQTVPLEIDPAGAETTAVVLLADAAMAADDDWQLYVKQLSEQAEANGYRFRLFPISFVREALKLTKENAVRVDKWPETGRKLRLKLLAKLTLQFSRMLRHVLAEVLTPAGRVEEREAYLKPVKVFLSHSKHHGDGEDIAVALRGYMHAEGGLNSFFDVTDIPPGMNFEDVIEHEVRQSAVVAIHTDSYSSREWCRREIIEAKKANVPLIVANCLGDRDERGFPYMGNVPIVRMGPKRKNRLDEVVARILDEVLKDYLWKGQVKVAAITDPRVSIIPRPPELISLATVPDPAKVPHPIMIYPDPPLSREEQRLFESVAPHVTLRTMKEWLAGVV